MIIYIMYHLRLCNHVHKACLHSECSTGILEVAGPEHTHNYFIIRCLINKTAALFRIDIKLRIRPWEIHCLHIFKILTLCKASVCCQCSVLCIYIASVHIPVKCRENCGACRGFVRDLYCVEIISAYFFQFFDIVYMVVIAKCRNCLRCRITKPAGRSVYRFSFYSCDKSFSTVHVSFPPYLLLLLIS